ncbi:hypothetical protein EOD41_14925 [Mucilaginibacter limnophilus]|uniref:HTH domain-containing protein n=1 Tax=Mucilaginibacter limnophilus TaxID=1932778 RepID=A0A3S2VL50_9SPHI|nr:hypothetical protein [Mucilaginibacter limnophilus]RVT99735.1 hypothetical protein EOD41_14925 [Mucilaginibacter limnophilus]
MNFRTYEERLQYLLELIGKKRLRDIAGVAERFDCSIRTVKRMLAYLREKGHDIRYDRLEKRYFIANSDDGANAKDRTTKR